MMLPNGKILPHDEIVKLITKYKKSKSTKIRDKIIMSNINAVYAVAHKYRRFCQHSSFTFDDLVSEGVLGLIEAIDRFDANKHVSFFTYAHWWVFKYINKNITFGTLELPPHRLAIFQKYEKLMQECANSNVELTIDEVCAKLKVSKKILLDTLSKKESLYLENLPSNIKGDNKLSRAIQHKEDFEDTIMQKVTVDKIKGIIVDNLTEKEAEVINGRFGLGNEDAKTLEELADELKISIEYVRILQNKSLDKIRNLLNIGSVINGE